MEDGKEVEGSNIIWAGVLCRGGMGKRAELLQDLFSSGPRNERDQVRKVGGGEGGSEWKGEEMDGRREGTGGEGGQKGSN